MTKLTIKNGDWVAVCDGRKALLIENEGDEVFPNFKTREVHEHKVPFNREIDTERPGRVQEAATTARSAIEPTDHHRQEEEAFLARLCTRLGELVAAGQVRRLVVVAPPRALGFLRETYSAPVQSVIRAEIDHDLVNLPIQEIEKHLTAQFRG
ncbi:MAG: host attachment protein [Beijerinckiaceae bacterium]